MIDINHPRRLPESEPPALIHLPPRIDLSSIIEKIFLATIHSDIT